MDGVVPEYFEFYSGRPLFRVGPKQLSYSHPLNDGKKNIYDRRVDPVDGACYWTKNNIVLVKDTAPQWHPPYINEDISDSELYGPE